MGLLDLPNQKIVSSRVFEGISDTLRILVDTAHHGLKGKGQSTMLPDLLRKYEELLSELMSTPCTLTADWMLLYRLNMAGEEIINNLDKNLDQEVKWWAMAFEKQCRDHLYDLIFLAPWVSLPPYQLRQLITEAGRRAKERIEAIDRLALSCRDLAEGDYDFLFDQSSLLLTIGYNVDDRRRDASCYDLLASEARLCSFVAIAQGHLPQEHWFSLGLLLRRRELSLPHFFLI